MTAPTRAQAQGAVASGGLEIDDDKDVAILSADRVRVEIDGRKQFFKLQVVWSWCIVAWISILIIFNATLTILVGCKVLDFGKVPWFVTGVTVETFLQVVGLGYVAARYLFSSNQKAK